MVWPLYYTYIAAVLFPTKKEGKKNNNPKGEINSL